MQYWLMKSEPSEVSFEDVWAMPQRRVSWFGIRNYQARNMMRDLIKVGDPVLFYHSSCAQPGIAGLAHIASNVYPDALQFDPESSYYDPKSVPENPRWLTLDVEVDEPLELISLKELRNHEALAGMRMLARGNRLSITPVTQSEYRYIVEKLARPRAL